ncbi:aminoglycoside phosphotransferase family protein [Nonomuraea sp. NPDC050310]|uniref:aminoglycoside phosphotransferase family protein n=1 Tax=Nonomuraea sp. NPDC050310 TaxID=3154935 RepID=UPI0033F8E326
MKDRPEGLSDAALATTLRAWGIAEVPVYAPVGFGDYHWTAGRWFVTATDLAHRPDPGPALAAAAKLGLDCVVAPVPTPGGDLVVRAGERYGVSVFPLVEGESGHFGQRLPGERRRVVLDALAELHGRRAPVGLPVHSPVPESRPHLDRALAALDQPWTAGPYGEPARKLVRAEAARLRARLAEFDHTAATLDGRANMVVTHGEPHPGNLLWHDGRVKLIDWDTVALAHPERDLWLAATEPGDLDHYAHVSGREPDPRLLGFYRLRWQLDDLAVYLELFRAPHTEGGDAADSWRYFQDTLTAL